MTTVRNCDEWCLSSLVRFRVATLNQSSSDFCLLKPTLGPQLQNPVKSGSHIWSFIAGEKPHVLKLRHGRTEATGVGLSYQLLSANVIFLTKKWAPQSAATAWMASLCEQEMQFIWAGGNCYLHKRCWTSTHVIALAYACLLRCNEGVFSCVSLRVWT